MSDTWPTTTRASRTFNWSSNMPSRRRCAIAVAVSFALTVAAAQAADSGKSPLVMTPLDSFKTGGAEIAAYDAASRRLFATNAAASTVTILDARDPANLSAVGTIDTSPLGSPNSVAVSNGLVAIAIEAPVKTDPGRVGFYKYTGE